MVSNMEALLTPYPALLSYAFYLKLHGTPLIQRTCNNQRLASADDFLAVRRS